MGANHSVFCHTCKLERELGHSGGRGRPCHIITGEMADQYKERLSPNYFSWSSKLVYEFWLDHAGHDVEVAETEDYELKNGDMVWTDYYGTEYVAIKDYENYTLDVQ